MTRFMQLMLDGKPVALPEDEYHMAVSRAQAQARQLASKPQRAAEPQADDSEDEPAAWGGN
jgi:hypothetical protein